MYHDDLEYASKRLTGTLVRLANGEPFYITSTFRAAGGAIAHEGTNLQTGDTLVALLDTLDLEPVPLGFVNITKKMVFTCRKPMRRDWHQGLSHNSLATCGVIRPDQVQLSWLLQPIRNQYPSFKRAIEDIKGRASIAFSRDFGLDSFPEGLTLRYRNQTVGKIVGGLPLLAPNKTFLQQHLDEAVGS